MSNSLLERVRAHQPRAFMMGDGGIFVTAHLLPPALRDEVLAYNARFAPPRARRVTRHTPTVSSVTKRPKSPQRIAREALWQACLTAGGPSLDQADEIAAELGIKAATDLILAHGAEAPMHALAERVWQSWGRPEPAA